MIDLTELKRLPVDFGDQDFAFSNGQFGELQAGNRTGKFDCLLGHLVQFPTLAGSAELEGASDQPVRAGSLGIASVKFNDVGLAADRLRFSGSEGVGLVVHQESQRRQS